MSETYGNIVGFGGAAIDLHLKGFVDPHANGHEPGMKRDFVYPRDYEYYDNLRRRPEAYTKHPGGNVLGNLAYLAATGHYNKIDICTVVGTDTEVSQPLMEHFGRMNIGREHVVIEEGYEPSVSIVEQSLDESGNVQPRMVRGRPRGPYPLGIYLMDSHIKPAIENANGVVIASTKSPQLNSQIFKHSRGKSVFVNFGSSEYGQPQNLRHDILLYKPNVVALNREELVAYHEGSDKDIRELAADLSGNVDWVLCTDGANGLMIAHNHDIEFSPCADIDPREIVNDLGAGDRATAITIDAYMRGVAPEKVPQLVAEGTLKALRVAGSHEDLYTNVPHLRTTF